MKIREKRPGIWQRIALSNIFHHVSSTIFKKIICNRAALSNCTHANPAPSFFRPNAMGLPGCAAAALFWCLANDEIHLSRSRKNRKNRAPLLHVYSSVCPLKTCVCVCACAHSLASESCYGKCCARSLAAGWLVHWHHNVGVTLIPAECMQGAFGNMFAACWIEALAFMHN
jgi:hypothetical protein